MLKILIVRVINDELGFIYSIFLSFSFSNFLYYFFFGFYIIFLILDLNKECIVILYVMVTQVTKHDTCHSWSYMSQSQVIQSYNTKKNIEGSRTDDII